MRVAYLRHFKNKYYYTLLYFVEGVVIKVQIPTSFKGDLEILIVHQGRTLARQAWDRGCSKVRMTGSTSGYVFSN